MATVDGIIAQIESLSKKGRSELEAKWLKAGSVKRRWLTAAGGFIVGVGVGIGCVLLFGCSSSPPQQARQCPPVTATFCTKGPTVVP